MDKKYTVFVSSTFVDLRDEREQVMKAILEMGHIPVGMEAFSAGDDEQWKVIQRSIDASDYYVVIAAQRYGSMAGEVSFTEREYDYAVSVGVPVLGFILDDKAPWPGNRRDDVNHVRLEKFKAKIKTKMVAFWSDSKDLYRHVVCALVKQMENTPRPGWIRGSELPSPETLNELARLSRENAALRMQVSEQTRLDLTFEVARGIITPSSHLLRAELSIYVIPKTKTIPLITANGTTVSLKCGEKSIEADDFWFVQGDPDISATEDSIKVKGPGSFLIYAEWRNIFCEYANETVLTLNIQMMAASFSNCFELEFPLLRTRKKHPNGSEEDVWQYIMTKPVTRE